MTAAAPEGAGLGSRRGMPALIWGGRGHAKVIRPLLEEAGHPVVLVYDRDPRVTSPFPGVRILHTEPELLHWLEERDEPHVFVVAIGGSGGRERLSIGHQLVTLGLEPVTLTHRTAWVDPSTTLGPGAQILAMAAISVDVVLGDQCILNTNASVDHECTIGDGVHVMPGATLAGCVEVGAGSTIGSNATVLPNIRIGADVMVAAGAVVTRDVADGALMVGVPATPRRSASATADCGS